MDMATDKTDRKRLIEIVIANPSLLEKFKNSEDSWISDTVFLWQSIWVLLITASALTKAEGGSQYILQGFLYPFIQDDRVLEDTTTIATAFFGKDLIMPLIDDVVSHKKGFEFLSKWRKTSKIAIPDTKALKATEGVASLLDFPLSDFERLNPLLVNNFLRKILPALKSDELANNVAEFLPKTTSGGQPDRDFPENRPNRDQIRAELGKNVYVPIFLFIYHGLSISDFRSVDIKSLDASSQRAYQKMKRTLQEALSQIDTERHSHALWLTYFRSIEYLTAGLDYIAQGYDLILERGFIAKAGYVAVLIAFGFTMPQIVPYVMVPLSIATLVWLILYEYFAESPFELLKAWIYDLLILTPEMKRKLFWDANMFLRACEGDKEKDRLFLLGQMHLDTKSSGNILIALHDILLGGLIVKEHKKIVKFNKKEEILEGIDTVMEPSFPFSSSKIKTFLRIPWTYRTAIRTLISQEDVSEKTLDHAVDFLRSQADMGSAFAKLAVERLSADTRLQEAIRSRLTPVNIVAQEVGYERIDLIEGAL
ncbi:hypothetical protein ACFLQ8_02500 [Candidatus Auribacterota bacterium]